jgi:peptide/nickel transport system permease protein
MSVVALWSRRRVTAQKMTRSRTTRELVMGSTIFGIVVLMCALVPIFSPYSPTRLASRPFLSPSLAHLFGTDEYGRDVFVRVFAGGRLDIAAGILIVVISAVLGSVIGTFSGATRAGWLDSVLMRIVDGVIAFPFIILVVTIAVIIGFGRSLGPLPAGVPAVSAAIILVDWTIYARLARNETKLLREREFVLAARLSGYSQGRILRRHLMPGVRMTTASYAVSDFILVVVAIASLSFIGVGVQPPSPEWGAIMYEGRPYISTAWWITITPGLVLAVTGVAVALIADSVLARTRDIV